ncbi:YceI family protein [Flagellimonas allohymeniacidonis]|uniref:YceI family protein n=1 Tax=Flagellimonas allohymeniacidonis TaxID=2517819 RepID=A0A4Q8QDQ7_9FLAO|nr:YceI family protein [Allomuricauda hymeniacidonis]TAI48531.1 YceI family protein [Allomuricauda hymeniacidonis]
MSNCRFVWFTLLVIGLFSASVKAQKHTYYFDQIESKIAFEVSHLGFLTVTGNFGEFSGTLVLEENFLRFVDCSIQVKSIYTNDKSRDNTLRSEAYLDVATYPNIIFSTRSISHTGQKLKVSGFLKIKNVQKPIDLTFQSDVDQERVVLTAHTIVNRKNFELDFGAMDGLIGQNIKVDLKLVGTKRVR